MRTVVVCLLAAVLVIGGIVQVLFLSPPAHAAERATSSTVLGTALAAGPEGGVAAPLAWAFPRMRGQPDEPAPEDADRRLPVSRVTDREDWDVSASALDQAPLWERLTWLEQRLAQLEAGGTGFAPDDSFWMPGYHQDLVRRGDEGHQVLWVQRRMTELGEYYGLLDGVFEERTEQAVISFQTRNAIKIDGIVGPETRARIYQSYIR